MLLQRSLPMHPITKIEIRPLILVVTDRNRLSEILIFKVHIFLQLYLSIARLKFAEGFWISETVLSITLWQEL